VLTYVLGKAENIETISAANLLKLLKTSTWGNARQCMALAATQKYLRWKYGHSHPALSAKLKRQVGKPQRALSEDQANELLASFDPHTPAGARDLAICTLAFDTGLRAAELCSLTQANCDVYNRNLQVIVKGGQWEAAIFTEQTASHIERWKWYRERIPGINFLFNRIRTGKGMYPEELNRIVGQWGKKLGIQLSPHDLRRSFTCLSVLLTKTPDRILMEGGRWKSPAMILRYTRTIRLEAMREHLPMLKLKNPRI
jgi:integrase